MIRKITFQILFIISLPISIHFRTRDATLSSLRRSRKTRRNCGIVVGATLLAGVCFHGAASPLYPRCLSGLPCVYFASLYTGDSQSSARIRCVSCTDLFQRFYPLHPSHCVCFRVSRKRTWLKASRGYSLLRGNITWNEALNYEQWAIVRMNLLLSFKISSKRRTHNTLIK